MQEDLYALCEIALGDNDHQSKAQEFGAFASVYIGDSVVIKCYHLEGQRDDAMRYQAIAHANGIGPKVLGKIDISSSYYPYAYISEKVNCDVETIKEKLHDFNVLLNQAKEIFSKEEGASGFISDLRFVNVGINNEGKVVIIDFCCGQ